MKRRLIVACGVLYMAACWAPQLWWGRVEAQEAQTPPLVSEVRTQRLVLVDNCGNDVGVLEVGEQGASLALVAPCPGGRCRVKLTGRGLATVRDVLGEDKTWRQSASVTVSSVDPEGPRVAVVQWDAESGVTTGARILAGEVLVSSVAMGGGGEDEPRADARLRPTAVEVAVDACVRARMGRQEDAPDGAGAEPRREGVFASYDDAGHVRWSAPK